jgi:hypothetical protein
VSLSRGARIVPNSGTVADPREETFVSSRFLTDNLVVSQIGNDAERVREDTRAPRDL